MIYGVIFHAEMKKMEKEEMEEKWWRKRNYKP
jgi:hypothetical protein